MVQKSSVRTDQTCCGGQTQFEYRSLKILSRDGRKGADASALPES